jgi:hypothetical protein
MHLFTITAGFLLLMLIQAQAATRNATIPAQTISSMPATPTTELGQKIEVALSIVFLIMGLTFSFAKGIGSLIRWILWPFTELSFQHLSMDRTRLFLILCMCSILWPLFALPPHALEY